MHKNIRRSLYLLTIIAVLLMSAMPSYAVYADGGTEGDPPAEDPAASPTDEEVPAVEGDSTSTPAEEKVSEDPQTEDNIVVEEATQNEEPVEVPKILEQVPAETDLMVLNEDGRPEPLASEAAAEILAKGNPIGARQVWPRFYKPKLHIQPYWI